MKKIYLLCLMMFMSVQLLQAQFFSENFETAGGDETYSLSDYGSSSSLTETNDSAGDFYLRTDGSDLSGYTVTGVSGSYFFALQDTDGDPPNPDLIRLEWTGIDITGGTGLQFSGLFAEDDANDLNEDWDADTKVSVSVSIDGAGYVEILRFEALGGTNTAPAQDSDFDGIGDGTILTSAFQEFSAPIIGTGSSLDLKIEFEYLDAGDEDIAIDNFLIISSSAPIIGFNMNESMEVETNTAFSTSIPVTIINYSEQVDLSVSVTGGTAESGDYTLQTTSLTFMADGTKDIAIDINPDADFEDETIEITIVETTTTGINISTTKHTITITDDDGISCGAPEWFTKEVVLNTQADTWSESPSGTYSANGFTGTGGDITEVWLIYGPLDMSNTSAAILEFDLAEGFDGGTGSVLDFNYTSSFTGDPGDAGNNWVSVGNFLGAGDDDVIDGIVDVSAASGASTFIGIKYTADGSGGTSSSVTLSNMELITDVCPASGIITWSGAVDSDWSNAANWDAGVPTSLDNVVIAASANDPVIADDAAVNEIKIATGEIVTVNSGGALVIMGSVSGSGDVTIERNTTGNGGYSILGAPIADAQLANLSADYLYAYFEPSATFENALGAMSAGTGFFVGYDAASPSVSFTGTPNSGTISKALSYIGSGDALGFNLVANPYAAAISMSMYRASNSTDTDGVIYLWDDGGTNEGADRGGDYITVSAAGAVSTTDLPGTGLTGEGPAGNGFIASTQGFFVKASTAGSVTFTPDMQVTTTGANADANHYRQAEEKQLIRLSISGNGLYNEILVGLMESATFDVDRGLDAFKFSGNELISFYSMINDSKFAIQALPNVFDESMEIQLGFDLAEAGTYTLNVNELQGIAEHMDVTLFDNLTGLSYNLSEVESITFTNAATSFNDQRFKLVLSKSAVLGFDLNKSSDAFKVYMNDGGLNIETLKALQNAEVKVYGLSGALISSFKQVDLSAQKSTLPFNKNGLFIITIQSDDQLMVKKFLN